MIWSFIGDFTERLAQHDDYGHYGAREKFFLHLSKQLQNWGHQIKLPVPWAATPTHRQTKSGSSLQLWRASHSSSVSTFQGF